MTSDKAPHLHPPFQFAVGIECTMVVDERLQADPPLRRLEQFELMRHYDMWQEDLELVARLKSGNRRVSKLRWCFPWYRMEATPGRFDFSWTDRVVDYANKLDIDLVPDIVHYGTPDWLPNAFLHPDYPDRVADFAAACAERYRGRIHSYTPLNEPGITASFSAIRGEWPPYMQSHHGFVQVTLAVARGIQKTVKAIRAADPRAETWAVEAMRNFKAVNKEAEPAAKQALLQELVCFDLVRGLVGSKHGCYEWLKEGQAGDEDLEELRRNAVDMDMLGLNFYPWGSKTYTWKDGSIIEGEDWDGMRLLDLLRSLSNHTDTRLYVTETSAFGGHGGSKCESVAAGAPDIRIAWMDATLAACEQARREGINLVGYTQFPLFTMVDWAYRLDTAPATDYYLNLGMVEVGPNDFRRRWTAVTDRFLHHLETFEMNCAQKPLLDCSGSSGPGGALAPPAQF